MEIGCSLILASSAGALVAGDRPALGRAASQGSAQAIGSRPFRAERAWGPLMRPAGSLGDQLTSPHQRLFEKMKIADAGQDFVYRQIQMGSYLLGMKLLRDHQLQRARRKPCTALLLSIKIPTTAPALIAEGCVLAEPAGSNFSNFPPGVRRKP